MKKIILLILVFASTSVHAVYTCSGEVYGVTLNKTGGVYIGIIGVRVTLI